MEINIETLQVIMQTLLSKLKEAKGNTLQINSDYYWHIEHDVKYDPYNDPKEITLGDLNFDWENLISSYKDDTLLPWHFKPIAAILEAIVSEHGISF